MSKILPPAIYFFADQTSIDQQQGTAGDAAFGPVAGSETTKFRVTSLHTGVSGVHPTAYAVCEGRVRLQEDKTDPNLLTLVLAPDADLLRGVPIRYFVYRGIRRDSLISGSTLVAGTETNPLLTDQLLNDEETSNDIPDALGLAFRGATGSPTEFTREDTESIDSIFFETTSLKAIPVKAGDRLGAFNAGGFGFEIMVASLWDPQPLSALRNVSVSTGNIIEIEAGTTNVLARAIRERVYGYLDPCAFYGTCFKASGGVRYRMGTSGLASARSAQDIYENLLVKFHNRNRVYLDIRNENGLSYNYYDTYGTGKIKLGLDTGSLQRLRGDNPLLGALDEFYDTSEWPLKIIESSRFTVPSGTEKVGIRLALGIGDPSAAAQRHVFYDFAYLFYNANDKKRGDRIFEPRGTLRWENVLKNAPDVDWTKDVVLAVPAVTDDTDTRPIAFHTRLRYVRQNEPQPATTGRYISTGGQWDNIFILQTDVERWKNTNTSNWWLTGQIKHVQTELEDQQVYEGRVEAGFAVDRDPSTLVPTRYTFYYVPIHVDREPKWYDVFGGHNVAGTGGAFGSSAGSFFQRKESGDTITGSQHLQLHKVSEFYEWNPDPLDSSLVAPPANPSAYLYFLTFLENPEFAEANDKTTNPNHAKESLYAISFSAAEYTTLLSHIVTAGLDLRLHPAFLQVRNRIYPRTDETATERAYQALELRIVGFDQTGNYCAFDVPSSGTGAILPLSLPADGFLFCTNDAARFENLKTKWDYIQICTQFRDYASMPSGTKDAEHQKDFIYFGRAMADLKRYHPALHQRMSILRNNGIEVILPGDPQLRRKRYQIKVMFDDNYTAAAGVTESPDYPDLIHIRDLQTAASLPLPPTDPGLTAFGGINETRYVRLNADRALKSSEVNAQFMSDYTDAELTANQILSNRLYIERSSTASTAAPRSRTTLAELKKLGIATFDPILPFVIRVNRTRLYEDEDDHYFQRVNTPTGITSYEVVGFNPRRWALTGTLAHELVHAEQGILDPLTTIVWGQLDRYFSGFVFDPRPGTGAIATISGSPDVQGIGTLFTAEMRVGDLVIFNATSYVVKTVTDDTHLTLGAAPNNAATGLAFRIVRQKVTKEIDPATFSFANFKLLKASSYPNPTPIVALNPALDAQLNTAGFMAKTGGGHLRGSPTGQYSCEAEYVITKAKAAHADARNKAVIPKDVAFRPFEYAVDYCFLNFDGANLNPLNTN